MTFEQQLVAVGHPAEDAARVAALPPVERMRALPVVGNAWSDAPLFKVLYYVLATGTRAERFEAMRKLCDAVGEDQPATEAGLQAKIDEVKQYLGELEPV